MKRAFIITLAFTLALFRSQAMAEDADGGFKVSGFVDADFDHQDRSGVSSFTLEEVEVDIEKTVKDIGGLRFDINYRTTDKMTAVSARDGVVESVGGLADISVEQGFVWLNLSAGLKFTFGKFNAPIGFELVDPNQMYQYSHAMVFIYGLPTNLTGAMLSGAYGMLDFSAYGVNGWDKIQDDNKDKTFGGRLGITPLEGVNAGLSYITGKEGNDVNGARTSGLNAFDADMTFTAVKGLVIGAEFNSGQYEGQSAVSSGGDAKWTGYLLMANYEITSKIAVTGRYDVFEDKDGARFGSGVNDRREAITFAPSYTFAPGLKARAEYKYTKSNQKVFVDRDGASHDNVTDIAVDFVYSF